jgi:hypothetical protein
MSSKEAKLERAADLAALYAAGFLVTSMLVMWAWWVGQHDAALRAAFL